MTKQLIFMILATLSGTAGVYVCGPFWGVFVYFLFATLRPQFMWEWSLPEGVAWSFYVAAATIGAAVLALLGGAANDERRPAGEPARRFSSTHISVFLFAAWIVVTYLNARDREAGYPWLIEYLKIFAMFLAAALLIRTVRQVWILLVMIGVTLAYIAYEVNFLYLAYQYLGILKNGYGGVDNNGAGLMLAMGVPLCFFAWEGTDRWWRWGFLALIAILIHAVLLTYSRGAMLSLIAVVPLLYLRTRRRSQVALFGLLLAVLLPVLAGKQIRDRFFTIAENDVDASAQSRRDSWTAALKMARDNPIFGVGLRNANLFSHAYGADLQGRTIHSQYFQIAADNGFVGLGLYLAILASFWINLRRVRRATVDRNDPEGRLAYLAASSAECSLAAFAVGAVFLTLDVFELPYLVLLLGAQLPVVLQPVTDQPPDGGSQAPEPF
jgi:probable O-glycosylation ligase (exosortase A-associated)